MLDHKEAMSSSWERVRYHWDKVNRQDIALLSSMLDQKLAKQTVPEYINGWGVKLYADLQRLGQLPPDDKVRVELIRLVNNIHYGMTIFQKAQRQAKRNILQFYVKMTRDISHLDLTEQDVRGALLTLRRSRKDHMNVATNISKKTWISDKAYRNKQTMAQDIIDIQWTQTDINSLLMAAHTRTWTNLAVKLGTTILASAGPGRPDLP